MRHHVGEGLWCEVSSPSLTGRPALFLDRDGVVVADTHYLGRPEDVRLVDGAASAIAQCNALEIPVVIVTNQSGIARGYYDWNGFHSVQTALCAKLRSAGAKLDAVLACAYHAEGIGPLRLANHPWRKPEPGMIFAAADRMKIDLSGSWIVGDRADDIAAGRSACLCGGIIVSAKHSEKHKARALCNENFPVWIASHLAAAVALLLGRGQLRS
jgi:D-glycero-D-manno-heptose 1,7-bisphosphate phosphatase